MQQPEDISNMVSVLTDDVYEQDKQKTKDDLAKPKWAQKRIDQLTAEKHAAKARIEELENELSQINREPDTDDPKLLSLAMSMAAQRDFDVRCNRVHASGLDKYADFNSYVDKIGASGGFHPVVVDSLIASPVSVEIIEKLGTDEKLLNAISKMPVHHQITELIRLERKIEREQETQTGAPEPIRALAAVAASDTVPSDTDDIRTWVKKRQSQLK